MSGSEHDGSKQTWTRDATFNTIRSASPAKRRAEDMEQDARTDGTADVSEHTRQSGLSQSLSSLQVNDKMGIREMNLPTSVAASSNDDMSSHDTPATSLASEHEMDQSVSVSTTAKSRLADATDINERAAGVKELANAPLEVGNRYIAVSCKWLARVLSRTREELTSTAYAKEDREGDIGPLDNSDIVPEGAWSEPILKDSNRQAYIPLRPGVTLGADLEMLPYDCYGLIVGWYGCAPGQRAIVRYAVETVEPGSNSSNIQYELFPPVLTIRKLVTGKIEEIQPVKTTSATDNLRSKVGSKDYGQMSSFDALQIVSSDFERFQEFLGRAKEQAHIKMATKVTIWLVNQSDSTTVSIGANASSTPLELKVEQAEWQKLREAHALEQIETSDETANEKYNGSSTMRMFQLFGNKVLILEEHSEGDKTMQRQIVRKTDSARNASPAPGGVLTRGRALRSNGRTRGTVGLQNLGNTCYMNSALQCIRSVEELAIYFLVGRYKQEINASNPLGYHGAMATKYADVVKGIYNEGASSSFTPSAFKSTLSRNMSTFAGFGQQDSQEFLSFLVDALHEDLNRIEKKPYVENPDSEDSRVDDPEYIIGLGEVYRKNHRARNDSVAMDLFSGFYKNTMECPVCDKVSVTFDPYSLLTLQLPIASTFTHNFVFVPLSGQPVRHEIDVEKSFSIKDLKRYIASKHSGVDPAKLWMIEVYSNKIYKVFDEVSILSEAGIQKNDHIFIYELEYVPTYPAPTQKYSLRKDPVPDMTSEKADVLTVPVIHRRPKSPTTNTATLHPQYISLTRDEARDLTVIRKKVLMAIAQVTSRPFLTEHKDVDEETAKDDARISDHSEPSDDDYVNVSVDGGSARKVVAHDVCDNVPEGFMDSSFPLDSRLTRMLYNLSYAKSYEGGHCASMSSWEERTMRPLSTRIKSRRSSIASSTSEVSMDETQSTIETDPEIEQDMTSLTPEIATPASMSIEDDTVTLNSSDTVEQSLDRIANGKGNKFKAGKKHNKERAALKREQKMQRQAKRQREVARKTPTPESGDADDNQYYIQVGECLLVDWFADTYDELFGGDVNNAEDERGHFLSSATGEGLPAIEDPAVVAKRARREHRRVNGITLEDCFAETGKREKLSEDNAWYCNRCKELRQATKTLEIWTLPDILVLHLKRFGGNRRFNDKIDVLVDYPIEGLELGEKVGLKEDGKSYTYDLFAVDNHFGGLGGGHYTGQAKNFFDSCWYDYNDSHCSKIGELPKATAAAYLLFYRRRSDKPLGPEYLQDLVQTFRDPSSAPDESGEDHGDGILRSSPGNSLEAGATALMNTSAQTAPHADDGSHGTPAEQLPKTKGLTQSNDIDEAISMGDDEKLMFGPSLPSHAQSTDWTWDSLEAGRLTDNESTVAEIDDNASHAGSFQDANEDTTGWNDTEMSMTLGDDEALHLENVPDD